ncbi:hypothetical protein ACSMXN_23850 [Jatrophihabitans sp. DSM 45814]
MRTLLRQELSSYIRSGQWLWPLISYVLVLIIFTALAVHPAPAAYGFIAPALLMISAWTGWLICSGRQAPVWQIAMVAVGGRERALFARWLSAVVAASPYFVLGVIAAEVGRQSGADRTGVWWGGIGLHLLVMVLGASIGIVLGVNLTERRGLPVPPGESTPLAALIIVAVCGFGAIGYAGAIGALILALATVGVTAAALGVG